MAGGLFRRGKDTQNENLQDSARYYAEYQAASSKGQLAYSKKQMALLTDEDEMRRLVRDRLAPTAEATGYALATNATIAEAINSMIVLLDVRPRVNARMHRHYDQVVRIKKSTGKFGKDLLAIVGPKEAAWQYPRSTYGRLLLFNCDPEAPDERDESIPSEGEPQLTGPRMFNFADMARVLAEWINGKRG